MQVNPLLPTARWLTPCCQLQQDCCFAFTFQSFVEVSQVGLAEADTYFAHTDPLTATGDVLVKVRAQVSLASFCIQT